MESIAGIFLLVAVGGNQQGAVSINEIGRFEDRGTCEAAVEAITAEVKATGKMTVEIGCISADNLAGLGNQ